MRHPGDDQASAGRQFGLGHQVYRQFRPPYPAGLYDRVLAALDPPHALAVDLGAGTGLVSATLHQRFARVIAVEPDPQMAAHIHDLAPTAEVLDLPAEQAQLPPGTVDLVACANAFHWMPGPQVAEAVAGWLRPHGVFAGWRYPMPTIPARVQDLIADDLPRWLGFLDPRTLDMHGLRTRFSEHPSFEVLADEVLANPVALDAEALLGFLRSVSFISAFLRSLGPDPEASERYLDGLADKLRARLGDDAVVLEFPLTLVMARRR